MTHANVRLNEDDDLNPPTGRGLIKILLLIIIALALSIVFVAAIPNLADLFEPIKSIFAVPSRRVAVVGVGLLLLVIALAVGFSAPQTDIRRAGIIIVMGLPALTLVFIGLATPSDTIAMTFIRSAFVATTIVFPAALFFLFIATRRESLLNAYLAHLERLGVMGRRSLDNSGVVALYVPDPPPAAQNGLSRSYEPEASRARRIHSYLDRFAAIFGKLPNKYIKSIIDQTKEPIDKRTELLTPPISSTEFELKTILPIMITSILIAIGWITILPAFTTGSSTSTIHNGEWFNPTNIGPASYAFLGAYFFSLQSLVRRFMRRDMGPNAYVAASSRIILSVIVAWLLVAAWNLQQDTPPPPPPAGGATPATASSAPPPPPPPSTDSGSPVPAQGTPVALPATGERKETANKAVKATPESWINVAAFIIGIFPFVLWQWLVNILNTASIKHFPTYPNLRRGIPLSELDGLTIWHETRLEEEDIENIANMADADIVDLMLSTKIPPHRIIDWVDQAILYRFILSENDLGSNNRSRNTLRGTLRSLGISTATALVTAVGKNGPPEPWPQGIDRTQLQSLADSIELHPNFAPVMRWKGLGNKILLAA